MVPDPPPPEADRIALNEMFKAIAKYGRSVRLRKQAAGEILEAEQPTEPEPYIKRPPARRKQKRKRKDGAT
jgi:hypothetical protein